MPTLHLLCGLPASGKTTLARNIEEGQNKRGIATMHLSADDWIHTLLPESYSTEERDRLRNPVERLQWELSLRLLQTGLDVILDWGFWSRDERHHYQNAAENAGFAVKWYFLEPAMDVLRQRIGERNAHLPPGTFAIPLTQFDQWASLFDPPDDAENESATNAAQAVLHL